MLTQASHCSRSCCWAFLQLCQQQGAIQSLSLGGMRWSHLEVVSLRHPSKALSAAYGPCLLLAPCILEGEELCTIPQRPLSWTVNAVRKSQPLQGFTINKHFCSNFTQAVRQPNCNWAVALRKSVHMLDMNARIEKVDPSEHFAIFKSSMACVVCILWEFHLLDAACEEAPLR